MVSTQKNEPPSFLSRQRSPSEDFENPLYYSDVSIKDSASDFSHSQIFTHQFQGYNSQPKESDEAANLLRIVGNSSTENGLFEKDSRILHSDQRKGTMSCPDFSPLLGSMFEAKESSETRILHSNMNLSVVNISSDSAHNEYSNCDTIIPTQSSDGTVSTHTSALSPQSICAKSSSPSMSTVRDSLSPITSRNTSTSATNTPSPALNTTHSPMSMLFYQRVSPSVQRNVQLSKGTLQPDSSLSSRKNIRTFNPFLAPPFTDAPPSPTTLPVSDASTSSAPLQSATSTVSTLPASTSSSVTSSLAFASLSPPPKNPSTTPDLSHATDPNRTECTLPNGWMESEHATNFVYKMLLLRKYQGYSDSEPLSTSSIAHVPSNTLDTSNLFTEGGGINFEFFDSPEKVSHSKKSINPNLRNADSFLGATTAPKSIEPDILVAFRALVSRIPGVTLISTTPPVDAIPLEQDNNVKQNAKLREEDIAQNHPVERLFFSQEWPPETDLVSEVSEAKSDAAKETTPLPTTSVVVTEPSHHNNPRNEINETEHKMPATAASRLDVAFQRLFGSLWDSFRFTSQGVVSCSTNEPVVLAPGFIINHHIPGMSSTETTTTHSSSSSTTVDEDDGSVMYSQETVLSSSDESVHMHMEGAYSASSNTSADSILSIPGWGGSDASSPDTSDTSSSFHSYNSDTSLLVAMGHDTSVHRNPDIPRAQYTSDTLHAPHSLQLANYESVPRWHGTQDSDNDHPDAIAASTAIQKIGNNMEMQRRTRVFPAVSHSHESLNRLQYQNHRNQSPRPIKTGFSLLSPPMKGNINHSTHVSSLQNLPETPFVSTGEVLKRGVDLRPSVTSYGKRVREGGEHYYGGSDPMDQPGQTRCLFSPDPQAPKSKRLSTHALSSPDILALRSLNAQASPEHSSLTNKWISPNAFKQGERKSHQFLTKDYVQSRIIEMKSKTQSQLQFPVQISSPTTDTSPLSSHRKRKILTSSPFSSEPESNPDAWIDARTHAPFRQGKLVKKR